MQQELAARRPDWMIPHELERAWGWLEEQGCGIEDDGVYWLALHPEAAGGVFHAEASLEGWFEPGTDGHERLLPIGDAAADGSLMALWWDTRDRVRVVVLDSEGSGYVVANDAREFVTLLAVGYEDLSLRRLAAPPGEGTAQTASGFRAWAVRAFGVEVPDRWRVPARDDEFAQWLGSPPELSRLSRSAP